MIRRLVKAGMAAAIDRTGLADRVGAGYKWAQLPLVVGYHRVVEDYNSSVDGYMPSMLTSIETLERQLNWIGQHFEFAEPDDMEHWLSGRRPGKKPVALVTFDDGYQSVYDYAFPLLNKKGIPAIVFVVTDLVGTNELQIHDELYLLLSGIMGQLRAGSLPWREILDESDIESDNYPWHDPRVTTPTELMRGLFTNIPQSRLRALIATLGNYAGIRASVRADLQCVDLDMLCKMHAAGIRIGSHTRSHALLTNEAPEVVADELNGSRRFLEQTFGSPPSHFAYPDGRFSGSVARMTALAGYRFGYTTCLHRDASNPMLTIPRRLLWENSCLGGFSRFSEYVMHCQVRGIFDFAQRCNVDHAS